MVRFLPASSLHPEMQTPPRTKFKEATRSAETCADPSLAQTIYQAFRADTVVHVLNFRSGWQNLNTRAGAAVWINQHPAFRAWSTQQPFTVPLFQLGTADQPQFIYMIGADAQTPPIFSGFDTNIGLVDWVYNTSVCESVPLMTALFSPQTDRYFTTSTFEHDSIASFDGWLDTGVIAFVLTLADA
ncbi:hypothetical protein D9619_007557 [Psilocybe cf. subviscida]|uniref:DUF5648 domain-containing protein n=1 Tax=Psilocybe cf. subviscida TaxID=2480587 RepID=A0A8H5EWA6_9AGAR|nr:hypothetical protein D9619_007557 [Psilocybe cf. subviscida]